MASQREVLFCGLQFDLPDGVSVSIVDGNLHLDVKEGFSGTVVVSPHVESAVSPTQSPDGNPTAPQSRSNKKRARCDDGDGDEAMGADDAAAEDVERTDLLSQRHRPAIFRNGGGFEDEEGDSGASVPPPVALRRHATWDSGSQDASNETSGEVAGEAAALATQAETSGAGPSTSLQPEGPGSPPMDPITGLRPRECGHSPAALATNSKELSSFAFGVADALDEWEWRKLEPTGEAPTPRWAHSAVVLGRPSEEAIFVFGGDGDASGDVMNDLYRLDVAQEPPQWRRCMDAPHKRAWHSAVAASDILLVFGGESVTDKRKKTYLGTMWSYDPEFEVWYETTDRGHRPAARGGHTACVHTANGRGVKLLVVGGVARGDRYLEPELHELHIGADWSWKKALSAGAECAPSKRGYHTCTLLSGDRMLVFGGNDATHSFATPHLLELRSMTWSTPATTGEPPAPRTGHVACCLDGHRVLIHGGWDPRANDAEGGDGELGPEIWDDLLILDTRTWSWSRPRAVHGDAPSPRTGHTLVPCGRALYLFGGLGETEVLGDSYVLVPRREGGA